MTDKEKAIQTIYKLLQMKKSPFENERIIAQNKINSLCKEFNLKLEKKGVVKQFAKNVYEEIKYYGEPQPGYIILNGIKYYGGYNAAVRYEKRYNGRDVRIKGRKNEFRRF